MEFNDIFKDGLKQSIVLFEKAFFHIMTSGEIDNVIRHTKKKEKKWLVAFRESFDKARAEGMFQHWWDCHWIVILDYVDSPTLLKDIILMMVAMDNMEEYHE